MPDVWLCRGERRGELAFSLVACLLRITRHRLGSHRESSAPPRHSLAARCRLLSSALPLSLLLLPCAPLPLSSPSLTCITREENPFAVDAECRSTSTKPREKKHRY
eukprot:scaffold13039_cov101-Isochrysis_galbana.AAC.1